MHYHLLDVRVKRLAGVKYPPPTTLLIQFVYFFLYLLMPSNINFHQFNSKSLYVYQLAVVWQSLHKIERPVAWPHHCGRLVWK